MSWYKDQWNERYYEAQQEAIDNGASPEEADKLATEHAEGLTEELYDAADNLRKARREEGYQ